MSQADPTSTAPERDDGASPRGSSAALYTLLSVMFINIMGFGIVVPLLPFYGQSFHAAPWQIALIFSAYSVGTFFGEPFWGRLSDRIGRKPILISTLLANCACYGALAFAPNIWLAFLIRMLGRHGGRQRLGGAGLHRRRDAAGPARRPDVAARRRLQYRLHPRALRRRHAGQALGGPDRLPDPAAGRLGPRRCRRSASCWWCGRAGCAASARPQKSRWAMVGYAARHPVISRLILLTFVVGFAFTGIERTFGLWAPAPVPWQPSDVGLCFGITGAGLRAHPVLPHRAAVAPLRRGADAGDRHGRHGDRHRPAALQRRRVSTIALMAVTAVCSSVAFPNAGRSVSRSTDEDHQGQIMGLNNAAGALARVTGPFTAGLCSRRRALTVRSGWPRRSPRRLSLGAVGRKSGAEASPGRLSPRATIGHTAELVDGGT